MSSYTDQTNKQLTGILANCSLDSLKGKSEKAYCQFITQLSNDAGNLEPMIVLQKNNVYQTFKLCWRFHQRDFFTQFVWCSDVEREKVNNPKQQPRTVRRGAIAQEVFNGKLVFVWIVEFSNIEGDGLITMKTIGLKTVCIQEVFAGRKKGDDTDNDLTLHPTVDKATQRINGCQLEFYTPMQLGAGFNAIHSDELNDTIKIQSYYEPGYYQFKDKMAFVAYGFGENEAKAKSRKDYPQQLYQYLAVDVALTAEFLTMININDKGQVHEKKQRSFFGGSHKTDTTQNHPD